MIIPDATTYVENQLWVDSLIAFERLEFLVQEVKNAVRAIIREKKQVKISRFGKWKKQKLDINAINTASYHEMKQDFKDRIHQVVDMSAVGLTKKRIPLIIKHISTRYEKTDADAMKELVQSWEFLSDLHTLIAFMYFFSSHGETAMRDRIKESIKKPHSQAYATSASNLAVKTLLQRAKNTLSKKEYDQLKDWIVKFVDKLIVRFPIK